MPEQVDLPAFKVGPLLSEDSSFRLWCEGLLEAFGQVGIGAVVLGAHGQVIFANPAAQRHFDFGTGIALSSGQLIATDRVSNLALQDLIHAIKTRDGSAGDMKVPLVRHGAPPLLAYSIPVDLFIGGSYDARGILVLADPQSRSEPTVLLLHQVFGLTTAEARLAAGLLKGLDLQEIAELHQVSVGTLRVQLKSIFAKTQTNRQAQLVAMLARLSF